MRTLLVDNHDSFTHNLFHHLAEVNGEEPEIVLNDSPHWHAGRLAEFDNVVISPGPGHPSRPADFGICHDIVRRTEIPLLGICLGHQGIGLFGGADVVRAPEPRHGRPSPVLHDGTDLFAGLPSPFEAVRYHSFAVTGLTDDLEATAWTPDGVLMGLRHRERPLWGVQFHPESVRTRYGHELLRNFARLTREHRAPRRRPRAPAPAVPAPAAPAPSRRLKVLSREVPLVRDPEAAYAALFRGNDHAYWLDSSRPGADDGRFSVMGDATGPLARVAEADVWSGTVTVREPSGTRIVSGPFLGWIEQDLRAMTVELPPLPGGFALGWVGCLGYELKAECGGDLAHRSEEPDATMVFADRALVVDHQEGTTRLLALAEDGDEEPALRWLTATAGRLAASGPPPAGPAPRPPAPRGGIRLRHDREAYLRLIDDCQKEIGAGESYEICLTNQAEWRGDLDVWESYRTLRRLSPAPFAALLQFGEVSVLSTSPERFVSVSADGLVESRPIKGTRPRGATPEQDAALVEDLLSSEKDRAENLMIVDLVRNDLGRCAVTGSVRADELFRVRSYATVHQLVSTVRARLRPDTGSVACVRAAFPGGSMTGAPKVRTMRIIDRLEGGARGIYSGAIGYFSLSGAADFSIVIRTAVLTPGRVRYGVGGAIVALSDADEEFEETAVKAAPLLALTGSPFPGRVRATAAV